MVKKSRKAREKKKEENEVVVVEADVKKFGDLAKELISLMGVEGDVETEWDEANNAVKVKINSKDSGLLIGRHGGTIEALQVIIAAMGQKAAGKWVRVVCNVGDYRERREETLVQVAVNTAKKAKFSGEAQILENLLPAERRIVHMALAEDKELETFSEGEGEERRLIIKPKQKES